MMTFKKIKGFPGKVFVPEPLQQHHKKHPCPDCFSCQNCGNDRCQICRNPEKDPAQTRACACNAIILGKKPKNETATI